MNSVIGGWLTSGTQHDLLDRDAEHDHHCERDHQRHDERHAALGQRDERQRGEEHHRPLREIEHARRL
jgi:hypothetical protein